MSQFLTAHVVVRGTRPILWHAFGPDALPTERKERSGVAGNDPTEWKRTVLMTEERQLYILPSYVYSCIREGGREVKRGRKNLFSVIAGTLQPLDTIILIDRFVPDEPLPTDHEQPVYLDICGVKNPQTKARNVRYRVAASVGWNCEFHLKWDSIIVNRIEMREAIVFGGQLSGLGDGRSVGNGRFEVLSYEVQDA